MGTKNMETNTKKIAVHIKDDHRGGIIVYEKPGDKYGIAVEIIEMGGAYWEDNGFAYDSLADAMTEITKIIKLNVECDFYAE
jgi:hypothetical protein